MQLFEDDFGKDQSPPDDTKIKQLILYFSEEESTEFKRLCKKGIKALFGAEANSKGNISDFLLKKMRQDYGEAGPGKPLQETRTELFENNGQDHSQEAAH